MPINDLHIFKELSFHNFNKIFFYAIFRESKIIDYKRIHSTKLGMLNKCIWGYENG